MWAVKFVAHLEYIFFIPQFTIIKAPIDTKKLRRFGQCAELSSRLLQMRNNTLDVQKKFIPQVAIDTEFAHSVFANPCITYNQRRSQSGVRITTQLTIRYFLVSYCTDGAVTLKGFQRNGDGQIFLKTLGASLFNDDLSNEPDFGRIHLAGQWL
jgi:hypothetical protein